jgi:CRP-like cAMP-binding protein
VRLSMSAWDIFFFSRKAFNFSPMSIQILREIERRRRATIKRSSIESHDSGIRLSKRFGLNGSLGLRSLSKLAAERFQYVLLRSYYQFGQDERKSYWSQRRIRLAHLLNDDFFSHVCLRLASVPASTRIYTWPQNFIAASAIAATSRWKVTHSRSEKHESARGLSATL